MTDHPLPDLAFLTWLVLEIRFDGQEQTHTVSLPTNSLADHGAMADALLRKGVVGRAADQTLAHV